MATALAKALRGRLGPDVPHVSIGAQKDLPEKLRDSARAARKGQASFDKRARALWSVIRDTDYLPPVLEGTVAVLFSNGNPHQIWCACPPSAERGERALNAALERRDAESQQRKRARYGDSSDSDSDYVDESESER